jgi:hypothetical protein
MKRTYTHVGLATLAPNTTWMPFFGIPFISDSYIERVLWLNRFYDSNNKQLPLELNGVISARLGIIMTVDSLITNAFDLISANSIADSQGNGDLFIFESPGDYIFNSQKIVGSNQFNLYYINYDALNTFNIQYSLLVEIVYNK